MRNLSCLLLFIVFLNLDLFSQITYHLTYTDSSKKLLFIEISFKQPTKDSIIFIMPRSAPGHYSALNYQRYITNVKAVTSNDTVLDLQQVLNSPRWFLQSPKKDIVALRYTVDIDRMEREQPSITDASIIRHTYAGILNYSVFGYIEGLENLTANCVITTFNNWPVFSTIAPKVLPNTGDYLFNCRNYYQLADGQTLMGPGLRIKEFKANVPIFIADYSEGQEEYLEDLGWQAAKSLSILNDYFNTIPFSHYTVVKQSVQPTSGRRETPLAMEHLNSCTLLSDLRSISSQPLDNPTRFSRMFGIFHHMAHAYIPLRCYGDQYKPYVTEIPPLIKNIWFNEGFIWFLCLDKLKSNRLDSIVQSGINDEIPALRKLGLIELSELGSLQYGEDFRIGLAIFSRGAMMASEIDNYVRAKTNEKKSMKDILQYLFQWSQQAKRPFTLEEFPVLLNQATGIDVHLIYKKWLLPLKNKNPQ